MDKRIVYGIHSVSQLLRDDSARVQRIYLQDDVGDKRLARMRQILEAHESIIQRVAARKLHDLTGTEKHQGVAALVVATPPMDEAAAEIYLETVSDPLIIVLDGVQDPRNFGSILRTANGAGTDLVVIGRNRNVGFTPAVSKVAAGAAEVQPVAQVANLARFLGTLKAQGIWVVGTAALAEQSLFDADLTGGIALVLGSEGEGLRRLTRERCDYVVRLPMAGVVESLNVAVSAGVLLYEALRQRA